jgi:parallel beta-helix repeat protein
MNKSLVILLVLLSACYPKTPEREWKSIEKDLQLQLIQAKEGQVIELPVGNYMFTKPLIMDGLKNVTIKGAGIDKTILSFQLQESGAEGIRAANCTNLAFEDFTIQDSKGDNIKITDTKGIRLTRIKSEWTGEPKEENGAYAFYPVLCKNVVVEECLAIGSSDAGIYVGQSDSVIIRNNEVYFNVAGIESENSRWVEIYGNNAHHNTGGILIFDMPGLTQSGHTTRVYDNVVTSNNYRNFAPEGNVVATVPSGTGVMMMATRNIEVFNNRIIDNRTIGTAIASYRLVVELGAEEGSQLEEANNRISDQYDPDPNDINIHDNTYSNKHWLPTFKNDFGLLFFSKFLFNTPDIAFDGFMPKNRPFKMCISGNGEFAFANIDAEHDLAGLTQDWKEFDCMMDQLAPIF